MKYWILATIACGMCLVNIGHTCHDVRNYGGTDLRVRVVGARALLRSINPYTIKDTEELDPALRDPDREVLSRCTYHPTLLFFYAPLSSIDYPVQREIWAVLEWCAFAGSVVLLSAFIPSKHARFWFCVSAIGLFGGSFFWRLHVERGQYYIFVVLLISVGMLLISRTRHSVMVGFVWGIAICLRPTVVFLVVPWLTGFQRRVGFTAIVTALVAVAGATMMGKYEYWLDFLKLSRDWELSLLSGVAEGSIDPEIISRPTDGYNTAIMEGYTANLTFVSLSRSVQTMLNVNINPVVMAGLGKVVWLSSVAAISILHWRKDRQQSERSEFQLIESQLLAGICLMFMTDYFLPIRVEYADVMFLIPMALLMPYLMLREYRGLTSLAVVSLLMNYVPPGGLPFNVSAISAMLRSFIVVYLLVRFTVLGLPRLNALTSNGGRVPN